MITSQCLHSFLFIIFINFTFPMSQINSCRIVLTLSTSLMTTFQTHGVYTVTHWLCVVCMVPVLLAWGCVTPRRSNHESLLLQTRLSSAAAEWSSWSPARLRRMPRGQDGRDDLSIFLDAQQVRTLRHHSHFKPHYYQIMLQLRKNDQIFMSIHNRQ